MTNCNQTNTPVVDNSLSACDDFYSSECVMTDYDFAVFGDLPTENLQTFFQNFEKIIRQLQRADSTQRAEIRTLRQKLAELSASNIYINTIEDGV